MIEGDAVAETRERRKRFRIRYLILAVLAVPGLYVAAQIYSATKVTYEYETAIHYEMTDSMEAEGVLLYKETPVEGSGTLGYLVDDGERVSYGTPLAEIYTDVSQAGVSAQISALDAQIALLEKSENTSSTQIDVLIAQRSTAIHNLLENIDKGSWNSMPELREAYLLAQNKLQITTGDIDNFSPLIQQLTQEKKTLESQLSGLKTINSSAIGYFVSAENTQLLTVNKADVLDMEAVQLQKLLEDGVEKSTDGLAGKIISGYTWQFCGICSLEDAARFEGLKKVKISFPGKMETGLSAAVVSVDADEAAGIAKFTLECEYVNAEVLKLGQETARISFATYNGLRVNADAVRYVKENVLAEDGETVLGEEYVPGVYVKYGNLARFRRITEIYRDADGAYILVPDNGAVGKESEVRLYDEIIVSGQELYDGKLL